MSSKIMLSFLALVSLTSAHVQINYPLGAWTTSEDVQETGAFCGGGSRSSAFAWGLQDAFISVSGDEGQTVTVMMAKGSTSQPPTVSSTSDFNTTLIANGVFGPSGNLCFNVTIPAAESFETGTLSTIYVQAAGGGANVSACADVAAVPNLSVANNPVIADGQQVLDPSTGSAVSYYEYYCSNGTVLALDTCSCHCHGTSEHCDASCSADRITEAKVQCSAGSRSSLSQSSSTTAIAAATSTSSIAAAASTTASSVSIASVASASASPSTNTSDASARLKAFGWHALVLVGGIVALAL